MVVMKQPRLPLRVALASLTLAGILAVSASSQSKKPSDDPVEQSRLALLRYRTPLLDSPTETFRADLKAAAKKISKIGDLSRMLLLEEWAPALTRTTKEDRFIVQQYLGNLERFRKSAQAV